VRAASGRPFFHRFSSIGAEVGTALVTCRFTRTAATVSRSRTTASATSRSTVTSQAGSPLAAVLRTPKASSPVHPWTARERRPQYELSQADRQEVGRPRRIAKPGPVEQSRKAKGAVT
jgi:hypothetical protein